MCKWSPGEDLNFQPTDYKSVALPIELPGQVWTRIATYPLVFSHNCNNCQAVVDGLYQNLTPGLI